MTQVASRRRPCVPACRAVWLLCSSGAQPAAGRQCSAEATTQIVSQHSLTQASTTLMPATRGIQRISRSRHILLSSRVGHNTRRHSCTASKALMLLAMCRMWHCQELAGHILTSCRLWTNYIRNGRSMSVLGRGLAHLQRDTWRQHSSRTHCISSRSTNGTAAMARPHSGRLHQRFSQVAVRPCRRCRGRLPSCCRYEVFPLVGGVVLRNAASHTCIAA